MQIALAWSPESEKELISLGFKKEQCFLKFIELSPLEENLNNGNREIFGLDKTIIPYQFITTGYYVSGYKEKISTVQIILAWRNGSEQAFVKRNFKLTEVYVCNKHWGPTSESNRKGDEEFFSMSHQPDKFVTTSYWGKCVDD